MITRGCSGSGTPLALAPWRARTHRLWLSLGSGPGLVLALALGSALALATALRGWVARHMSWASTHDDALNIHYIEKNTIELLIARRDGAVDRHAVDYVHGLYLPTALPSGSLGPSSVLGSPALLAGASNCWGGLPKHYAAWGCQARRSPVLPNSTNRSPRLCGVSSAWEQHRNALFLGIVIDKC